MKKKCLDFKASLDCGCFDDVKWNDIFLEAAKKYLDTMKDLDEGKEDDPDNEEVKNDSNWYNICLEAAKRYQANMKDLDENKEDNLEDDYYDDEEARDDAAFADFDRKHVSGYDDFQRLYDYYNNSSNTVEDCEDKCHKDCCKHCCKHFGVHFDINKPRLEDYKDRKKFEDDKEAFDRFVKAGKDCVKRGLEKPKLAESVKINDVIDDIDDDSYFGKIYLWF